MRTCPAPLGLRLASRHWLMLGTVLVSLVLPTFGQESAPTIDIQAELDRRQASLNAFLQSRDPEQRIRLLEEVRNRERLLLGQPLPAELRARLLDEHIGLLEHLAQQFQWEDPSRELLFREEIVAARTALHGDQGDWRIAWAKGERNAAQRAAALDPDRLHRLKQASVRTQQAAALVRQGDPAGAESLLREAAATCQTLLGGDCLTTGQVLRMHGQVLLELERGREAALASYQAAGIIDRAVGKSPLLIAALGDCGSGLHVAGETARAVVVQRQAVAVAADVLGKETAEYATQINNLAYFLSETGALPEALKLVIEAGSIYEKRGATEAVADNANLTGTLSMKAGRHDDALAAFRKAAELRIELAGERQFQVAVAWGNASQAAMKLGRLGEADSLIVRGMAVVDETVGRSDPRSAELLIQWASVRREQGRMKEAAPVMEQACSLLQERYGLEHPAYALASLNLAAMRFEQGRHAEAEGMLLHAAEVFEAKLGPQSGALAVTLTGLAQVQARRQQGDLARQALDAAGRIALEALEQQHPETADHLRRVADAYRDLQDDGPAVAALNQAVKFTEQHYGNRHPEYAATLLSLGEMLLETPEPDRGAALIEQGSRLLVDALGREQPQVMDALLQGVRAHRYLNRPEEALKELVDLDALVERELGRENGVYANLLLETGRTLLLTGDAQAAERRLLDAAVIYADQYGDRHPRAKETLELIAAARSGDPSRITGEAIQRLEQEAIRKSAPLVKQFDQEEIRRTQQVAELMRRLTQ